MTTTPRARPRVVLLAEPHLVAESVSVALSSRGIDSRILRWPEPEQYAALRRTVRALQPRAAVLLGGLDEPSRRVAAREIVRSVPMRWLVLVDQPDSVEWGGLLDVGIAGLLSTSAGLDDLASTLTRVMAGRELVSPLERSRRVDAWTDFEEQHRLPAQQLTSLTPRELSVLAQLYDGVSVTGIAEHDRVSVSTVRSQVKAVLRKLGVSSQLEAVAVYRRVLEHLPMALLEL